MKKITENTKVTLTLKQLKKLVKEGTTPESATLKFIEAAISPDDRKGRKSWESVGSFECRFNKRKGLVRIVGCSEEVWQIAKKAGVGLDEIDWTDAANGEDILVKVDPETMQKAQEIFDKWVGYWDEQYGRVKESSNPNPQEMIGGYWLIRDGVVWKYVNNEDAPDEDTSEAVDVTDQGPFTEEELKEYLEKKYDGKVLAMRRVHFVYGPNHHKTKKPSKRSSKSSVFSTADDIREWMLKNEQKVVKMMGGNELGATTWVEFVTAVYEGERPDRKRLSYAEFVNDFCKEGTCWEEFEGTSVRGLADMLNDYAEYWM